MKINWNIIGKLITLIMALIGSFHVIYFLIPYQTLAFIIWIAFHYFFVIGLSDNPKDVNN